MNGIGVRKHTQDAELTADALLVEPLEAAARHLGGGAVAETPRHTEPECRLPAEACRVARAEQQRAALEPIRRDELDLRVEVAPVRGKSCGAGVPGARERRLVDGRLGNGLVRAHELDRSPDPLLVEPSEQPLDKPRRLPGTSSSHVQAKHVAAPPRVQGSEQSCSSSGGALVLGGQPQTRVDPALGQLPDDLPPLFDEAHEPEHKLKARVAKVEKKGAVSEDLLREFFREMLLIRRFEEKVEERFRAGELPGFLHVAIGQEACAVGVCRALEEGDVIASTHRAHGHTLAKGTHPNEVMAELYGKLEGCSHGYGGSMHLYDVERGNLGANAVVGGGLPAAVGAALSFKFRDEPRVAVAFFGDGATNIGTFHESLNLAQLWQVPVVFVCENNRWAESTPASQQLPIEDLTKRAAAFGMEAMRVDGQDVEEVYQAAHAALDHAREGRGPVFLLLETYRLTGHYIGDAQVYRPKGELEELRETQDPITKLRERIGLTDEEFEDADREAHELVEASVEFAKNGTDPKPEDALKNLYA